MRYGAPLPVITATKGMVNVRINPAESYMKVLEKTRKSSGNPAIGNGNSSIEGRNLTIEDQNSSIGGKKSAVGNENLTIENEKPAQKDEKPDYARHDYVWRF